MGCGGSNLKDKAGGRPGKLDFKDGGKDKVKLDAIPPEVYDPAVVEAEETITEMLFLRNSIKVVPDQFCALHANTLLILNLSNNELTEFPTALCFMPSLTQLIVGSNKIKRLPAEIGKLEKLTVFGCGGNEIEQLPDEMGQLKRLTQLTTNNNKLKALPDSLCGVSSITSLNLMVNPGLVLPADLGNLTKLTALNVSHCSLDEVPASLGNCVQLKKLELDGNNLTEIPETWQALLATSPPCEFKLTQNTQLPIEFLEQYQPAEAKRRRAAAEKKAAAGDDDSANKTYDSSQRSLSSNGKDANGL